MEDDINQEIKILKDEAVSARKILAGDKFQKEDVSIIELEEKMKAAKDEVKSQAPEKTGEIFKVLENCKGKV